MALADQDFGKAGTLLALHYNSVSYKVLVMCRIPDPSGHLKDCWETIHIAGLPLLCCQVHRELPWERSVNHTPALSVRLPLANQILRRGRTPGLGLKWCENRS